MSYFAFDPAGHAASVNRYAESIERLLDETERSTITNTIVCRAHVSEFCSHGRPTVEQFGANLPLEEDGTFDGSSIVCDACYVALIPLSASGMALNHELPALIQRHRIS